MAFEDWSMGVSSDGEAQYGTLQSLFNAVTNAQAGATLGEQQTGDSVSTDAIRAMGPDTGDTGSAFSGFWGAVGGIVSKVADTELARYQARRGVPDSAAAYPGAWGAQGAQGGQRGMLLLLGGAALVGLVAFLVLKK